MAVRSTAEEMDRLQLSDEDTGVMNSHDSLFDQEEAREAALRSELQSVRRINEVLGGLLSSLDQAKGNMETVSRTVFSASTLLDTWTRILSQTEHNQRLLLNPNWQGATQDMADMEQEALLQQQAAERREQELQRQRDAAARKAQEDEIKRAQATTPAVRGPSRGRVRPNSTGRPPSSLYRSTGAAAQSVSRGSTTTSTTRQTTSGIARGTNATRGRGRA